ncbi:hypothetical protein [Lewinella sp. LCG006]|uniref:hypothetical protein n=1 Tax=Lewinella sp. LCG006 TaxID=3231911 RepID=UPI003460FE00
MRLEANNKKRNKMLLMLTVLLLLTGGYFALSGIKLSVHSEKEINEEIFNKVREEIEFKLDSIFKEKKLLEASEGGDH